MELDRATQSFRGLVDVGAGEARIEDEGLHVGVEANRTVDVCFDAVVQVVESGGVGHAAQVREEVPFRGANQDGAGE